MNDQVYLVFCIKSYHIDYGLSEEAILVGAYTSFAPAFDHCAKLVGKAAGDIYVKRDWDTNDCYDNKVHDKNTNEPIFVRINDVEGYSVSMISVPYGTFQNGIQVHSAFYIE